MLRKKKKTTSKKFQLKNISTITLELENKILFNIFFVTLTVLNCHISLKKISARIIILQKVFLIETIPS